MPAVGDVTNWLPVTCPVFHIASDEQVDAFEAFQYSVALCCDFTMAGLATSCQRMLPLMPVDIFCGLYPVAELAMYWSEIAWFVPPNALPVLNSLL